MQTKDKIIHLEYSITSGLWYEYIYVLNNI